MQMHRISEIPCILRSSVTTEDYQEVVRTKKIVHGRGPAAVTPAAWIMSVRGGATKADTAQIGRFRTVRLQTILIALECMLDRPAASAAGG